jgi:endo-1,4-beta-xylanase
MMLRRPLLLLPLLPWLAVSAPAGALETCEPAACTLREAAARAGIHLGVAVSASELVPGTPSGDLVAREFSSLTPENEMKHSELAPAPGVWDFSRADALVAAAEANGQRVRGHTVVWGRPNGPPAWLESELAAALDPAARLREITQAHVAAVVGRYAGRIAAWDVVNEPLALFGSGLDAGSVYQQLLGPGYVADAFRLAHAADPGAQLFLNEVFAEQYPAKFDGLLALVDALLAEGVPLHGVGLQGHFLAQAPDAATLVEQMAALGSRGLAVEITELDLPLFRFSGEPDPLAAQARAYADVVSACLAVSTCRGITVWGISDAETWLDSLWPFSNYAPNRPLLFDEHLDPKPAYDAVRATLLAAPEPGAAGLVAAALALAALARSRAA